MSEHRFNLTGWQAIAAVVVLIGVLGVRLMTFNDMKGDAALMKEVEAQLMSDYFPHLTGKLQDAFETGDMDKVEGAAQSVLSTKLDIERVQASYPLFDFSSPKDVVVKVTYSMNDDYGSREERTNYYFFKHDSLRNNWRFKYETNIVRYYLNFQ